MPPDRAASVAGEPSLPAMPPGIPPLTRPLVLVGLMGAGKSSVGRRLARMLAVPFADADDEIVTAAGMSIPEIFERYGEPEFRMLERRVIARLLDGSLMVLALGGGAFIDPTTRALVKNRARSVWLRADLETLLARTARKRGTRPLLSQGDPRQILAELIERRHPVYAEADHVVDSTEQPPEIVIRRVLDLLHDPAPAR